MEPTQDPTGVVQKSAGSCSGPKCPQHPHSVGRWVFFLGGMAYDGAPPLPGSQPGQFVGSSPRATHLSSTSGLEPHLLGPEAAYTPGRTGAQGRKGRMPSHDPTCLVQGRTAIGDQKAQMCSELKVTWLRWFRSGSKSVPHSRYGRGLTLSLHVGQTLDS